MNTSAHSRGLYELSWRGRSSRARERLGEVASECLVRAGWVAGDLLDVIRREGR